MLSFREQDISYVDLNRATWIKNFRIGDEYLINGELHILNETEIHDLSFRIKALPITSINTITNLGINKNVNLNNKTVSYTDNALKE